MTSMQQMIERINSRLATLERENRERPDWLTRLMLAGPGCEGPSPGTGETSEADPGRHGAEHSERH